MIRKKLIIGILILGLSWCYSCKKNPLSNIEKKFLIEKVIKDGSGNIVELQIRNVNATKLPKDLFSLTSLKILVVSGGSCDVVSYSKPIDCNYIRSLPDEIVNLTQLEYLSILNTDLQDITFNLSKLNKLKYLDFSHNKNIDISRLYHLKNISSLSLNECELSSDDINIQKLIKMKNLNNLGLEANFISKSFIDSIQILIPDLAIHY